MTQPERLRIPYGPTIGIEAAKRIAAAAVAEAGRQGWAMAVAVADPNGDLVYFEKMDTTQFASIEVAIAKARSSARYKRATKVFENRLASGGDGLQVLGLTGAVPVEGGLPLVADGLIVGAIGVSGGLASEDGIVAAAGAAAL